MEVICVTSRLYYEDPYLCAFDARITQVTCSPAGCMLWLDRSAFYPTSGGQPFDRGTIAGHPVTDVLVMDGDVIHIVQAQEGIFAPGLQVHCEIDEERRRDHMQQHCGEHMLASLVWKRYGGFTHGLHIGETFSSIDVTMPDGQMHISDSEIIALEEEWNRWIQSDAPIRCWFPTDDELASLPLRKDPGQHDHTRMVFIAPDEYCACGGTHPLHTGEVGCGRILSAKPARGKMRLSFVCGMRAVADARKKADAGLTAAELLSTAWEELPCAVERLLAKNAEQATLIRALQMQKLEAGLLQNAKDTQDAAPDGAKIVLQCDSHGADFASVREAVCTFAQRYCCYVLAHAEDKLCFACAESLHFPMNKLLSATTKALGGKGGGNASLAQGSAPQGTKPLQFALDMLISGAIE